MHNKNLYNLSRQVIEPYVAEFLSKREKVDHVEISSPGEDQISKIDLNVYTVNGKKIPVQVKTRTKNYNNFTISPKDIINEQEDRVFCFIDKTLNDDVVCTLLDLNEMAMPAILDESPKILMLTQKKFLADIDQFKLYNKDGDQFYLISKDYLYNINYNKGN